MTSIQIASIEQVFKFVCFLSNLLNFSRIQMDKGMKKSEKLQLYTNKWQGKSCRAVFRIRLKNRKCLQPVEKVLPGNNLIGVSLHDEGNETSDEVADALMRQFRVELGELCEKHNIPIEW